MDRARIPWRDHEAYDDWADIAQTLYANIVVRSIETACNDRDLVLPRYHIVYPEYSATSLIALGTSGRLNKDTCAFIGFKSVVSPFDHVLFAETDPITLRRRGDVQVARWGEVNFVVRWRRPEGFKDIVQLKVPL